MLILKKHILLLFILILLSFLGIYIIRYKKWKLKLKKYNLFWI